MRKSLLVTGLFLLALACKKHDGSGNDIDAGSPIALTAYRLNDQPFAGRSFAINRNPVLSFQFSAPVDKATVAAGILLTDATNKPVPLDFSFGAGDSIVSATPASPLEYITRYGVTVGAGVHSRSGIANHAALLTNFVTTIDSTAKFPAISDDALITLVQQQTFKYFYDFAHPVSGLARERSTSGDVVTTGGSGFGIMALLVGASRNFVSRADALARVTKIVGFLTTTAHRYHGAFPHWLNGATGATVPFSSNDDGADLVETSFLMEGLLCARQYFNGVDATESSLRQNINTLWHAVEWSWFRQGGQDVLYWHWSPNFQWTINQPVTGWNEALMVYVLAASADSAPIPKIVYDNGWAKNGGMKNGTSNLGIFLPLGESLGGPLFFAHYSFMGIDPNGLSDAYANYQDQNTGHARTNYQYCVNNPKSYNGYGENCWGLTASDDNISGYAAHSPTNDLGIISPTAAVSSLPYTPAESMRALKFFYYTLGDKLWGEYGFRDAFNLTDPWFADSYLAIDQGPQIVMIENYRSGLMWKLFMSCPEIKTGMKNLGFQGTSLN